MAKISRRFRGRTVQVSAAVTTNGDADPRNNFGVDRNRVKAAKRKGSSRGKPAPSLAEQTSAMPEVIAPPLGSIDPKQAKRWVQTFGGVCRIALS